MNKKVRKPILFGVIALLIFGGAAGFMTIKTNAMSASEAQDKAMAYVPEGVSLMKSEEDWNSYDFTFVDEKTGVVYEVEVSKTRGKVTEVAIDEDRYVASPASENAEQTKKPESNTTAASTKDTDKSTNTGSQTANNAASSNQISGNAAGTTSSGTVNSASGNSGAAAPATNTNTATTQKSNTNSTTTTSQQTSTQTNSGIISESQARSIVLGRIPGATIRYIHLDYDDGIQEYEGEAVLGNTEYDFAINASTGVIIEWDVETMDEDD